MSDAKLPKGRVFSQKGWGQRLVLKSESLALIRWGKDAKHTKNHSARRKGRTFDMEINCYACMLVPTRGGHTLGSLLVPLRHLHMNYSPITDPCKNSGKHICQSLRLTTCPYLLTTGLEPATQREQILSLSCLPISPSELIGKLVGSPDPRRPSF